MRISRGLNRTLGFDRLANLRRQYRKNILRLGRSGRPISGLAGTGDQSRDFPALARSSLNGWRQHRAGPKCAQQKSAGCPALFGLIPKDHQIGLELIRSWLLQPMQQRLLRRLLPLRLRLPRLLLLPFRRPEPELLQPFRPRCVPFLQQTPDARHH